MILSGPSASQPGKHALDTTKAALVAYFVAKPLVVPGFDVGTVAIITSHTEATDYTDKSQRPFIFLEVGDAKKDDSVNFSRYVPDGSGGKVRRLGARWLIEVVAEVVTVGACSPAEEPLKDALISAIESSYKTLRDAGFEGVTVRAGSGRDQKEGRVNPHAITGAVHVLF